MRAGPVATLVAGAGAGRASASKLTLRVGIVPQPKTVAAAILTADLDTKFHNCFCHHSGRHACVYAPYF